MGGRDRSIGSKCRSSDAVGQSGRNGNREDIPGRGAAKERHDRTSKMMNLGKSMLALCLM